MWFIYIWGFLAMWWLGSWIILGVHMMRQQSMLDYIEDKLLLLVDLVPRMLGISAGFSRQEYDQVVLKAEAPTCVYMYIWIYKIISL